MPKDDRRLSSFVLERLAAGVLGLCAVGSGARALVEGRGLYLNYLQLPVPAPLAVAVGIALVIVACLPLGSLAGRGHL